jgi:hypothetical protein
VADINVTLSIPAGITATIQVGSCVDHFVDLLDCPTSITANQYVKGNAGGTDLEFGALPTQVAVK